MVGRLDGGYSPPLKYASKMIQLGVRLGVGPLLIELIHHPLNTLPWQFLRELNLCNWVLSFNYSAISY